MSQENPQTAMACSVDGTCFAINNQPDRPADSIELKIGEDIDWIDVSSVYDRDNSLKETTNPKSHNHTNTNPKSHNHTNNSSNSQRFSGNLKPSIIGLPGKIQNSGYLGHSSRRPAITRIFPKKVKTGRGGKKQAVPETEPGSPKVSCIGKVLSERERVRRRLRQNSSKSTVKKDKEGKISCWVKIAAIFSGGSKPKRTESEKGVKERKSLGKEKVNKERNNSLGKEREVKERNNSLGKEKEMEERNIPAIEPPGIGGMKKFTSGRKVEWDFEVENYCKV